MGPWSSPCSPCCLLGHPYFGELPSIPLAIAQRPVDDRLANHQLLKVNAKEGYG